MMRPCWALWVKHPQHQPAAWLPLMETRHRATSSGIVEPGRPHAPPPTPGCGHTSAFSREAEFWLPIYPHIWSDIPHPQTKNTRKLQSFSFPSYPLVLLKEVCSKGSLPGCLNPDSHQCSNKPPQNTSSSFTLN